MCIILNISEIWADLRIQLDFGSKGASVVESIAVVRCIVKRRIDAVIRAVLVFIIISWILSYFSSRVSNSTKLITRSRWLKLPSR